MKSKPSTLPPALRALIDAVERETRWSPERAAELLRAANLSQDDLLPWAEFDHPAADSYGRRLVHNGGHYEMMVMAWTPGDVSAIHDHGHTQWGAVQVFGPAEHAVFWLNDGRLYTQSRVRLNAGGILEVGHQFIHQLGNTSGGRFLSFHFYGCEGRQGGITHNARVFDLDTGQIQFTDNGVFFALPDGAIDSRLPGPVPDFMTRLRHQVELKQRLDRMRAAASLPPQVEQRNERVTADLFDGKHWDAFESDRMHHLDPRTGHMQELGTWHTMRAELYAAAALQERLRKETDRADPFATYAELYDAVIGKPYLEEFIEGYLEFVFRNYPIATGTGRFLSLGCGTGIVEDALVRKGRAPYANMYGMDKSEAMIAVAQRRIQARAGDLLDLKEREWDVTFCGLNVFQYLSPKDMQKAIETVARITRPGGFFVGDFITPDHIRVYPHVIRSKCGKVISLRQPELIEDGGHTFQRSAILNVSRLNGSLEITDEGRHRRYLPPMTRVRQWFENAFWGRVDVYDAVTLNPIDPAADTCPSTRYLLVAHKK